LDEAIAELEGEDWEEVTGRTDIHVAPGGQVVVDQTGRFQAVEPRTRPDAAPAPVSTGPTDPRLRGLRALLAPLPPWGQVIVLVALISVLGLAVWRGGGLAGLWP
jgi:hypothetical protein